MSGSLLEVRALHRRFGPVHAVRGVDLDVRAGELVGLVGHNGAGKSTLMSMLLGLLPPSEGTIRWMGRDAVADLDGTRALLGAVPEEPGLFDALTAVEHAELVVALRGGTVEDVLEVAALGDAATRCVGGYSQGMRRRLALGLAMAGAPPLLILDEALNGLDLPSIAAVQPRLRQHCDRGGAVLLSTHVPAIFAGIVDRVVWMSQGKVLGDVEARGWSAEELTSLFLEKLQASSALPTVPPR
jgi:ABC-type multidrug transport system ATPase subunit